MAAASSHYSLREYHHFQPDSQASLVTPLLGETMQQFREKEASQGQTKEHSGQKVVPGITSLSQKIQKFH